MPKPPDSDRWVTEYAEPTKQPWGDQILWILAVLGVICLIIWADNQLGDEPPNNEPYTGLCNRPTTQAGC